MMAKINHVWETLRVSDKTKIPSGNGREISCVTLDRKDKKILYLVFFS